MRRRGFRGGGLLGLALAGCAPHATLPAGTVATVDGAAITADDLAEERRAGPSARTRRAALDAIIDRRVLAEATRAADDIDEAQLETARARVRETILATLAGRAAIARLPAVDAAALTRHAATHPAQFGRRAALTLDVVGFAPRFGVKSDTLVARAESLEDLQSQLRGVNVAAQRAARTIDSATLSAPLALRLFEAAPGAIVGTSGDGGAFAIQVVARRALAPLAPAAARRGAAAAARDAALARTIAALRSRASLSYTPGYAPDTGKRR